MSEVQRTAELRATSVRETTRAPWPGAGMALVSAVVSGLVCWFWLLPQLTAETRPASAAASVSADLAEVAPADLDGALSTMDLPASTVSRLRQDARQCGQRLAWVTLVRGSGQAPETVRVRSGQYFSPALTLPATPVRVAIPFPAPYESGEGSLTVLGAESGLTVALTPAWSIPPNASSATHRVTWRPSESCKRS